MCFEQVLTKFRLIQKREISCDVRIITLKYNMFYIIIIKVSYGEFEYKIFKP